MSIMCSIMLLISCDDNTKESQFTSCKNPGCRSACRVTNEWHSRIAYAMPLCWGVTRQFSCNFNHQWLLNQGWLMMLLGGTYQPTSQTEHWDKFTSHKWSSVVISMGYYMGLFLSINGVTYWLLLRTLGGYWSGALCLLEARCDSAMVKSDPWWV